MSEAGVPAYPVSELTDIQEVILKSFVTQIDRKNADNANFREVLFSTSLTQLVVMNLKVGEEIGADVNHDIDQLIRVESGAGMAVLDGRNHDLKPGYAVVIPAAVDHNIVHTSNQRDLKLYTIYPPPAHPDGTVHHTKAEADAAEH